jgi:hypothetical protein
MKKVIIAILLIIAVGMSLTAFAAAAGSGTMETVRGNSGAGKPGLTEKQRKDMLESFILVLEARKEAVEKLIGSGIIQKEQGEAIIARLNMEIEYRRKYGMVTRGITIDPSKLTGQQKEDLLGAYMKIMEAEVKSVEKMVKNGVLTEEQGKKQIDALKKNIEHHREKGFQAPLRFFDMGKRPMCKKGKPAGS